MIKSLITTIALCLVMFSKALSADAPRMNFIVSWKNASDTAFLNSLRANESFVNLFNITLCKDTVFCIVVENVCYVKDDLCVQRIGTMYTGFSRFVWESVLPDILELKRDIERIHSQY